MSLNSIFFHFSNCNNEVSEYHRFKIHNVLYIVPTLCFCPVSHLIAPLHLFLCSA